MNEAPRRWWRYAVLRGDGIPARLDGVWYDLAALDQVFATPAGSGVTLEATNQWEQREDGEVAAVYRWVGGNALDGGGRPCPRCRGTGDIDCDEAEGTPFAGGMYTTARECSYCSGKGWL